MHQTHPHDAPDHALEHTPAAVSRRGLIGGIGGLTAVSALGLAAGTAGSTLLGAGSVHAAPGDPQTDPRTEALDPVVVGLAYTSFDALAFFTETTNGGQSRVYQETPPTGVQPLSVPAYVHAPLTLPIGAVLRQINVSVQGQPIISVAERDFASGLLIPITDLFTPTAGGGVKTQTFTTTATLAAGKSYVLRAFCSAGDSVLGVSVGYLPPAQAFVPFLGSTPRVLDTREAGFGKFGVNEDRVIDLSGRLVPTARAAVINLTATETTAAGFLAAYTDGISWPGNSTVNFSSANATVANSAIVTMTAGKIKVRSGAAGAHVIVDVIGSLL
ncbi:MAG: hypothetical protein U0Q03_05400 [Acidimicrobiales bacterium]